MVLPLSNINRYNRYEDITKNKTFYSSFIKAHLRIRQYHSAVQYCTTNHSQLPVTFEYKKGKFFLHFQSAVHLDSKSCFSNLQHACILEAKLDSSSSIASNLTRSASVKVIIDAFDFIQF